MDFWRRSARISRKYKIRNNIIEQKMNVINLINHIVSVNTTNKLKFLLRHVSASQGHHQAYKEVPTNLDYYNLLTRI